MCSVVCNGVSNFCHVFLKCQNRRNMLLILETDRNSVSVSAPKVTIWTVSASFVFGRMLICDFRQRFGLGRKSSVVSAECRKFTLTRVVTEGLKRPSSALTWSRHWAHESFSWECSCQPHSTFALLRSLLLVIGLSADTYVNNKSYFITLFLIHPSVSWTPIVFDAVLGCL